jgi:hypothetical protein
MESTDDFAARIVREGGQLQKYRPLKIVRLFERFIDMAQSEDGVLKFIKTYGPLSRDGLRGDGDLVPQVIDWAEQMSNVLQGRTVRWGIYDLKTRISVDPKKVHIEIRPTSLVDAIRLQLFQEQSKPKRTRECPKCRKLFSAGVGGRRADAVFCSDECRIRSNSLARSRKKDGLSS